MDSTIESLGPRRAAIANHTFNFNRPKAQKHARSRGIDGLGVGSERFSFGIDTKLEETPPLGVAWALHADAMTPQVGVLKMQPTPL